MHYIFRRPRKITTLLPPTLDIGLISFWKFDEGAGVTAADSIGGANLSLQGDATWVPGHRQSALGTSGTGYAVGSTTAAYAGLRNGPFTFCGWFSDDRDLTSSFQRFISIGDGAGGMQIGLEDRHIYYTNAASPAPMTAFGASQLPSGPNFFAVTFDGATYHVYANGVDDNASPGGPGAAIVDTAGTIWIGQRGDGGGFVVGWQDEYRIYGRALTPAEILALSQL